VKILYLCTGNSARSQMAEAFTRAMLPANAPLEVYSAGTRPAGVHPETIAVMREAGIDLSGCRSKSIDEVPFASIDLVVTLCDDASSACPKPPEGARRLHWGLRDPAAVEDPAAIRDTFRAVRDEVRTCVKRLLFEIATSHR